MVDKDNMSVEEMLAYCRKADGGEAGAAPEPKSSAPAPKPAQSGKKPAEMSMEEMLAAARGEGGGSAGGDKPAKPDAKAAREMSMEEMLAAARGGAGGDKPAKPKPDAKAAREMSMEEMLAAARGGGGGEKPAPKAKPSAKAAPKAAAKAAEPAGPSGPKDTGSIFGERNPHKPGPKSKAEAAASGSEEKPAEKKMPVMPARPAYATPQPAATAEHRRSFFAAFSGVLVGSSMAVGFASLAVTHLLWALGLAKFMFPNILIEPPTKFKVGFPGEYAPGQVQTKFKAQFGVWVVRYEYQGEQQIYALKAVCTHLGCTPNWLEGEQKFKCPCHGSGFYKDGVNFEGPAPRPLERYAIRVSDDGQLEVDKSQAFNEEKGQWTDPASFVRV